MGTGSWIERPTFNFIREEVMQYCNDLPMIEEQIAYLCFVLLTKKNHPPELDENIGLKPTLEDFIENEIDFRKFMLTLSNKQTEGITKMRGKMAEVVRIFEAMKTSEIISLKTEAAQIGRVFFSEKMDIKSFALKYNARKKDLIEEERSTSSEPLVKFVNDLIEISFKGKTEILDKISTQIERVKKNRIY